MKRKILLMIILCLVIAFISFFGGHHFVKITSGDKFCNLCHEWMNPMTQAYLKSPHGGNNTLGIKAECATCHLPHDSMIKYIVKKGLNGISESAYMLFNNPKSMNWQANRSNRQRYVFDSGCLQCHSNILNVKSANPSIDEMHEKYVKFKDDPSKQITCVTCHKTVGHEDLGRILYEIKNPPVGNWSDSQNK